MPRIHYTSEEKSRLLAKFEEASTSAAAFCRAEGLSYQTFLNWRRSASDTGSAELPRFIEVELGAAPRPAAVPAMLVELELGGGIVLRLRHEPARS